MADSGRRVLLVGSMDGFANRLIPEAAAPWLRGRGHDVIVFDTFELAQVGPSGRTTRHTRWSPANLLVFAIELAISVVTRAGATAKRTCTYPLLRAQLWARGRLLRRLLPLDGVDLVICFMPHDSWVLPGLPTATMYHCPTPWADELFYEGRLSARQHRRMRAAEIALMQAVDHVSFFWHSYADYARREYGITGSNFVTVDAGITPVAEQAQWSEPPRIVFMSLLSSKWIDLPGLSRLARLVPIDVYGGPPPDPALGLTYKGWAPPEVLSGYQFGLITSSKDPLRRGGVSAKHLDYYARGLPVLLPAWREDETLWAGAVRYTEETFAEVVADASRPERWAELQREAREQAERYAWTRTLEPLDGLLREL